jgi:hypothetical protein
MDGERELRRVAGRSDSANQSKEERRRYNREYMRRWRADPRHRLRELDSRVRAYQAQKEGRAVNHRRLYIDGRGRAVCGFCWRRSPIRLVVRLRISEAARNEYVKVLIPCCGEC